MTGLDTHIGIVPSLWLQSGCLRLALLGEMQKGLTLHHCSVDDLNAWKMCNIPMKIDNKVVNETYAYSHY